MNTVHEGIVTKCYKRLHPQGAVMIPPALFCPNCSQPLQGSLLNPLVWVCLPCDFGLVLSIPEAQRLRPELVLE